MASRERTIENKIKFYENKIVASETLIAEEQQKLEGYKMELKNGRYIRKILKNYFKKLIKMFNLVKITSAKKYTL